MTPEAALASYRRMMDESCEVVTVRRYTGSTANRVYFEIDAVARRIDYKPEELTGTIVQGDRKLILLHEDLANAGFPLPLRKDDKIRVKGRDADINIQAVDDNTRRVKGVLIAYELQVRGL